MIRIWIKWSKLTHLFYIFCFFSGDNYVATLTLGGAGAHATYYHKANDQVLSVVVLFRGSNSPVLLKFQYHPRTSFLCCNCFSCATQENVVRKTASQDSNLKRGQRTLT